MFENTLRNPTDGASARRLHCFMATIVVALISLGLTASSATAADEDPIWQALRGGGHVALLRHALAPGTGDPDDFELGNCDTQRNLSEEGRDQARRTGERFRENGIAMAAIYTSQWCRCRETAELLALGSPQDLALLNSFFRRREQEEPQTAGLKEWLMTQPLDVPMVLVTHQVNITALTGVYPRSGAMVVVRLDEYDGIIVIGTLDNGE